MKSLLEKLSISAKINIPIIALALALCGTSVWLSRVLVQTDQAYSGFLDNEVMAQVAVLKVRSAFNRMVELGYEQLSTDDADQVKGLASDIEERIKRVTDGFDKAEKLVPELKLSLVPIRQNIDLAGKAIKSATEESLAGHHDAAKKILAVEVKPLMPKILGKMDELQKQQQETVDKESDILAANSAMTSNLALGVSFSVALLMFGAAFVISRTGITRPLAQQISTIDALCRNDLSVAVEGMTRGDEIGNLARAANVFRDNLVRVKEMEAEKVETEQRNAERRRADMERLASEFQRAVGGIVETVASASSQLESAATSLQRTASSTQSLSNSVAAASEETSANVQGVATASEQLASTVTEIGRQVQESSEITTRAVNQASATNTSMLELSQAASRIGDVVSLITSIAGQTNLLALNATIEAARAGDAGKGFAVVAQEVKALASQTEKATNEIGAQITSMQAATGQAVNAIQEITQTINRVAEISNAIAAAIQEQDAATKEISRNVMEAAKGTTEVANNITSVSSGAAETGSASAQVLVSAKQLSSESGNLRTEVDKFIAVVRAA